MGKRGNILVMQSGGSTPVLNRSLFGIADEACEQSLERLFGAVHGIEGLISGNLVDLSAISKARWHTIARSPGAALGSTRRTFKTSDTPEVIRILTERGIRYCFIIGGNDSAETGLRMSVEAAAAGLDLTVINVPKTIDNDLVLTDHCPGYGSAARFVALATMGAGRDAEAMGVASPVTILEVMGRDAGWLAASAALAQRNERDAPHVICLPEVPIEEDRFLGHIEDAYRRFGFAVAVVSENARGTDGVLGRRHDPWQVDEFGHPYFEGAGRHLTSLVRHHLKCRVRYERPGTIQRSMTACVSQTDAREAEMAGRAAVRYAIEGASRQIVTLLRENDDRRYACTTGLAPLDRVAGRVRPMPDEYLDKPKSFVTAAFVNYARPLIGAPLPRLGRLL